MGNGGLEGSLFGFHRVEQAAKSHFLHANAALQLRHRMGRTLASGKLGQIMASEERIKLSARSAWEHYQGAGYHGRV